MNKKLINAVIEQIGEKEDLKDVMEHGADAGFSGFIYYNETCKFFDDNRDLILELVGDMADDLGTTKIGLVKSFRCLNNNYSEDEIGKVMYGTDDEDTQIKNALAWFALEEVARHIYDR